MNQACSGNPALRAVVEEMLASQEQAEQLLESGQAALQLTPDEAAAAVPEQPATASVPEDKWIGTRIGQYKIVERIGEGGCGLVYMAEQETPVRRRVALKIIKLGMDTKSVIARFDAERQALALMDHPNIARVLDAGATDSGRPYFVMELVHGTKITEFCDKNGLSTPQRLELFIDVCHAIQHAHQKGIIHRDIKPSNILVALQDGRPVPKVIDFGIAKAIEGKLTEQTLFTPQELLIGTPAYMSPEQAEIGELDVDTRSDIYSLGV
ncbi:MAG TPA: serine/threonine-protein kinase, partial [Verrucomicrobiae bacterium]